MSKTPSTNNLFSPSEKKSGKSRLLKVLIVMLVLVFLAAVIAFFLVTSLLQPANPQDKELVRFVIPRGQSVAVISERLEEESLIKNARAMQLYYRFKQDDYNVQAGSYELSPAMSVSEILSSLSSGADDIWITFPEGLRREEIAQSLEKYELPNYDKEQFLLQTVGLEGRLFPDTYLVPREITTQAIISLMSNTFDKKLVSIEEKISQSSYSLNELIVMASLLEREARGLDQMQRVAGVLFKRLEVGMPLQVDATLQYAKGFNEQTQAWWSVPRAADKQLDSRYNTYQNPGLPPGPICNPGMDALTAAATPLFSDYLYYIHDSSGQIHFARTLQEHNRNIEKYLR